MTLRVIRTLAAVGAVAALLGLLSGCSKPDAIDTAAPPPTNPNAQREMSPYKRMPARPPAFGSGPAKAPPKAGPGTPGAGGPGTPGGGPGFPGAGGDGL